MVSFRDFHVFLFLIAEAAFCKNLQSGPNFCLDSSISIIKPDFSYCFTLRVRTKVLLPPHCEQQALTFFFFFFFATPLGHHHLSSACGMIQLFSHLRCRICGWLFKKAKAVETLVAVVYAIVIPSSYF